MPGCSYLLRLTGDAPKLLSARNISRHHARCTASEPVGDILDRIRTLRIRFHSRGMEAPIHHPRLPCARHPGQVVTRTPICPQVPTSTPASWAMDHTTSLMYGRRCTAPQPMITAYVRAFPKQRAFDLQCPGQLGRRSVGTWESQIYVLVAVLLWYLAAPEVSLVSFCFWLEGGRARELQEQYCRQDVARCGSSVPGVVHLC